MPDPEDKDLPDEEELPETSLHAHDDDREEQIEGGDSSDDVGDTQAGGPSGAHDEEE